MSQFTTLTPNDNQEVLPFTNLAVNVLNGHFKIAFDRTNFPGWAASSQLTGELALAFCVHQKIYLIPFMGDNVQAAVFELTNRLVTCDRLSIEATTNYVSSYSGSSEGSAVETMFCDASYMRIFPVSVAGTKWHLPTNIETGNLGKNGALMSGTEINEAMAAMPTEMSKQNIATDSLRFFKMVKEDMYTVNGVLTPYAFFIDKKSKSPDIFIHNSIKSIIPTDNYCQVTLKKKNTPLSVTFTMAMSKDLHALLTAPMNQLIFTDPMFGHIYLNVSDFDIEINQ